MLSTPIPKKFKDSSYSDYVCNYIRNAILSGDAKPGDRIREKDLGELLSVSRTPLREAMKSLETQGLIKMEPWKGAIIADLDRRKIIELYDLRILLECLAVELAAEYASDADIAQIKELHIKSEKTKSTDQAELTRLNTAFHEAIGNASHNRFIGETLHPLRLSFALMRGNAYGKTGHWPKVLSEHGAILNAIKSRDRILARNLMREHITGSASARLLRLALSEENRLRRAMPAPNVTG